MIRNSTFFVFASLVFFVSSTAQSTESCQVFLPQVYNGLFPWDNSDESPSFTRELSDTFIIPPVFALTHYNYEYDMELYEFPLSGELIYENKILNMSWPLRVYRANSIPNGFSFALDENIDFLVSENISVQKILSPPKIIDAKLSIEEREGFWNKCQYDDGFYFSFENSQENLKELGVLLLIYFAQTEKKVLNTDQLIWAEHVKESIYIDLERIKQFRDPFCISIQTIDIAGEISPRSEPLCIDPQDDDSPYVDNPNAGCGCSSVTSRVPAHPLYAVVSFLLLLCRIRRSKPDEMAQ